MTAACDEGSNPWFNALRGGGHAEDAPEPACRCGIYAWKHGVAGTVPPRRPHAVGSVHLSGTVIEGTTGYRARWATIDGPLELFLPCGSARSASPCDSAPVVVRLSGADFVGACARHDEGGGWRMAAAEWRAAALVALGDRYLTPIM